MPDSVLYMLNGVLISMGQKSLVFGYNTHTALIALCLGILVFSPKLHAQNSLERHRREITEESSAHLVNLDIWDSNVSLFISGFWRSSLTVNWGIANSPLGMTPRTDDSPLLFTQEADLTLSLWIWQKWFLEVSFIDDYDLNTYRAGYQGFPGETVQYIGVGNTGLDFPVFPYLDLGGDSASSFGVYGRFGSNDLTFHTIVRYDAAAREEKVFVGNRERSFFTASPDRPLRGRSFVLPNENISTTPIVYFEDRNGPFMDVQGRRWRLARPSEFAVSAANGLVELVREHQGLVAVSYGSGNYTSSLGTYASTGFLNEVQQHFGDAANLSAFPQPGGVTGIPATIVINGDSSLVIYEPGTFSPFERQSRYLSPSSSTQDAALIVLSSGERLSGYELLPALSFFLDNSLYTLSGDTSTMGIFEIVSANSGGRDRRSPASCWPLARDPITNNTLHPELYLPASGQFFGDIRIRYTNYGPAGAFTIGTDVIPGSVQVFRGGIQDSQISYNPGTGIVSLASPVGFNEVIRISYLKRSEERRLGSFVAGAGVEFNPDESPFSAEAALGLRWNISQEAYTEEGASSPGTVGLGARTSWNYDTFMANVSLGLGFDQPDTTGLYRIAGMDSNSEMVLGVSTSAGFISERPVNSTSLVPSLSGERARLIYRNYLRSDWLGGSELMSINWSAPVVSGMTGPYPARDGNIDVFVAEFELTNNETWTGFQVPLGRDGELLQQARAIMVPIRFYDYSSISSSQTVRVIAQFGTLAEEGSGGGENPNLLVEFELFQGSSLPSFVHAPLHVLSDEMRRSLQNPTQFRILIIHDGLPGDSFSGRLLVGKPILYGSSWRGITLVNNRITAAPDTPTDPGVSVRERREDIPQYKNKIDRLNSDRSNHVLYVSWRDMPAAGTDGRVAAIPLSDYRVLSFFIKGELPASSDFHFLVSSGPDTFGDPGRTAIQLTVPGQYITNDWHNFEILYRENKLLIDGNHIPEAIISYNPSALRHGMDEFDFIGDGQSHYIAAFVTNAVPDSGSFSIDEITLEDPAPSYRINLGAALDWRHPDTLLNIGDREIVSDLVISTAMESAARGDPFDSTTETFSALQSRSHGEITILDTRLTGDLSFMVSSDISYWSAGHSIQRNFGPVSIFESFNTNPPPNDSTMNHSFSLGLNSFVNGSLSASANFQNMLFNRFWTFSTAIQPELNGHPGFRVEGSLNYLERTDTIPDWMHEYGSTWVQSWVLMIPDEGSGSKDSIIQNRNTQGTIGFSLRHQPVGLDLAFSGNTNVSIPMTLTQSSSSARVDSPFILGPVRGNLRLQRRISQRLYYTGDVISDDMHVYGQSLHQTSPLWKSMPVYSLFNPNLDSAMNKSLQNYTKESENTSFHELLGLNLIFPERYDVFSLIVPVNSFFQLDRNMDQRMDTLLDVFSITAGFGFSAVNLFGAMGSSPRFNFYRNDELRHSISGVFAFPRDENLLWRIQAEQNLGIFGFRGAEFGINNMYTIIGGSQTGWINSFSLVWLIPREKTLLSSIYDAGMRRLTEDPRFPAIANLAASPYEIFLRETLEIVLDNSGEYSVYTFSLGHESLVRVLGRLTLSGFAKLGFQQYEYSDMISLLLSFGTTLTVSF